MTRTNFTSISITNNNYNKSREGSKESEFVAENCKKRAKEIMKLKNILNGKNQQD